MKPPAVRDKGVEMDDLQKPFSRQKTRYRRSTHPQPPEKREYLSQIRMLDCERQTIASLSRNCLGNETGWKRAASVTFLKAGGRIAFVTSHLARFY
jgi:hypothetical protein